MITLQSAGFKFGHPKANIIFDVSFLKNPWRESSIRYEPDKSIQFKKAIAFMREQEDAMYIADAIYELISAYYLKFSQENIQVALCCSAGEYRSPIMVEMVAAKLKKDRVEFIIKHSEQSKI